MIDFEIEFARTYVTSEGSIVRITKVEEESVGIIFTGSNDQQYLIDGTFRYGKSGPDYDSSNLISLAEPRHLNNAELNTVLSSTNKFNRRAFDALRIWGEKTFGDVTPKRIVERAKEELDKELLPKLTENDEWTEEALEEAADIVVILTRAPGLWEAVERKMKINCKREWNLRGDGTGYHKAEEE